MMYNFNELCPELAGAVIADLREVVSPAIVRNSYQELAELGLLTSPWGILTHKGEALVRWAQEQGKI